MIAALTRRFKFGLRTLLVAVTLIGMIAAWIGWEVRAAEIQRRTVRAINAKAGSVCYDRGNGTTLVVFQTKTGMGCGQIVPLNSFSKDTGYFRDEDLPLLERLRHLGSVDFTGSRVSDTAIQEFKATHPRCIVRP